MTDLREFLYVDVDRTRSLLAQLQGGVIEEVKSQRTHTAEGGMSAKLLGVGGRGDYAYESGTEESRSLQDLTFAVFEELAENQGWIQDLGEEFTDPDAWSDGRVHGLLAPGQVVRIVSDLQVLDGGLFRDRMKRFDAMAEAILKISPPETTSSMSRKERQSVIDAARLELMGDVSSSELEGIADFIEAFQGDSVALRVLPCGSEHLEFSFSGSLLGRREYMQEEREHLFSRYGTFPTGWTAVLQIAAIPTKDQRGQEYETDDVADEDGLISRSVVERMAAGLLVEMERLGVMDGPRWPSISVTPLGVYRGVPAVGATP